MPLLLACADASPLVAAGLELVSGLGTAYGTLYWIFEVPGFGLHHSLMAGGYLALYPAFWYWGVSVMGRTGISPIFPAAALWVILDYVRAHAGVLAFP